MKSLNKVEKELHDLTDDTIAEHSSRFFKTGMGEYGEGDIFLGIRVPEQRKIAKKYRDIPLEEVKHLLASAYHEVRLTAIFILVYKYKKSDTDNKEIIYRFYMDNLDAVNNWDLVDSSAGYIAGHYLIDKDKSVLYKFAKSDNLWKRRISIIATSFFISKGLLQDTFQIAELLLKDQEDLIHKAVGWMLRETGKKDRTALLSFLKTHYSVMPRTMLRYSIEKFPDSERKMILAGDFSIF